MKAIVKNAISRLKTGAAAVASKPGVDYPLQGETITSRQYTYRIAAPETAESVDISINQGPWLACRNAAGYWWYDWAGYCNGKYEVIARIPGKNGRWTMTLPNEFSVLLKP